MGTIDLSSFRPVAGTDSDAALVDNAFDVIQTLFNGNLDNNNIAANAGIAATKLSVPYATYVPTWTASGAAPAIGDASVFAHYAQIGKMVHAYGRIVFGAGSTYGTGTYSFALPGTAAVGSPLLAGAGLFYDNSSGNAAAPQAFFASTTTFAFQYPATYLGALTTAGQLAPWTWATSDIIAWNIFYEAA